MNSTTRRLPYSSPREALRAGIFLTLGGMAFGPLGAGCEAVSTPKSAAASGSEGAPAATRASPASAPPDLAAHMQASFWEAIRARDALISADLPAAQRAAEALANQDLHPLVPADWLHWVNAMQQSARELSMAPTLASASAEIARLALICGECHELHRRDPDRGRTDPQPWPEPQDDLEFRMLRHQIGADQLWDGLVLPSENLFRSGTMTLARAPLAPPEQNGRPVGPALQERIEAVRTLARQAREATTYSERGRVYGELIARCADCHYHARPAE
jgi:hypothetical protein